MEVIHNTQNNSVLSKNKEQESKENSSIDFTPNLFDIDFSKEYSTITTQNKNYKPLIQYNKKSFNTLIFTNFTAQDFNLFMCLCFIGKNKNNARIKLSFKDLEELMEKKEKNQKRLFHKFDEFIQKAMKIIIKQESKHDNYTTNKYTGFFDFIQIYEKEKMIIFQFNNLMISILNNFAIYTQFELKQYCELKSKYSKQIYTLLMDNAYKNERISQLKIDKDKLFRYLEIKNSQTDCFLLETIKTDFNKIFLIFQIQKEYGGYKNKKIIAYNFIYKK